MAKPLGGSWTEGSVKTFTTALIELSFYTGSGFSNPFNPPSSFKSSYKTVDTTNETRTNLVTKVGGYTLVGYGYYGCWSNSSAGFNVGSSAGNYIEFPAISGKKLTRVGIISGTESTHGNPAICPADSSTPVTGGEAHPGSFTTDEWYEWNLSGTTVNTAYRIYLTTDKSIAIRRLTLTYE